MHSMPGAARCPGRSCRDRAARADLKTFAPLSGRPEMKTDLHIHAIPAFSDNYIWMMHDGRNAVVVDPGAAGPVEETLAQMRLSLNAIVLTHLHYDHCWGVPGLLQHWPVPVYGPILND